MSDDDTRQWVEIMSLGIFCGLMVLFITFSLKTKLLKERKFRTCLEKQLKALHTLQTLSSKSVETLVGKFCTKI